MVVGDVEEHWWVSWLSWARDLAGLASSKLSQTRPRFGGPGTHVAVPAHPPRWARTAGGGAMGTWSPTETPT